VGEAQPAAHGAQGGQGGRAPGARHGNAHGVAVAHQIGRPQAARQVRVEGRQVGQHPLQPEGRGLVAQGRAIGLGQRVVDRPHRRHRPRVQALVGGVHIAQAAGAAGRGEADVVPGRRKARARQRRLVQRQVADQPGRVAGPGHRGHQGRRRVDQHPGGDEQRQRQHRLRGLPGLDPAGRLVPDGDADALPVRFHRQHGLAGVQALTQRLSQALREPAIALGPGEQARIGLGRLARGVEAVPAGEVMQPGPGRDRVQPGAVVVAAGVVQVGPQAGVVQALGGQPGGEGLAVQRGVGRRPGRAPGGQGKAQAAGLGHPPGKAAVLVQRGGRPAAEGSCPPARRRR
jgi:hypothetical protein